MRCGPPGANRPTADALTPSGDCCGSAVPKRKHGGSHWSPHAPAKSTGGVARRLLSGGRGTHALFFCVAARGAGRSRRSSWGCSNGSSSRDDHSITHPDPDPPVSTDPPPVTPPVINSAAGDQTAYRHRHRRRRRRGRRHARAGMVIHSGVGMVLGVSVDEGAKTFGRRRPAPSGCSRPARPGGTFEASLGNPPSDSWREASQPRPSAAVRPARRTSATSPARSPTRRIPLGAEVGGRPGPGGNGRGWEPGPEHHYEIHNNNGVEHPTFDETRSILSCIRVNEGPRKGDLYTGSNPRAHSHPGRSLWRPPAPDLRLSAMPGASDSGRATGGVRSGRIRATTSPKRSGTCGTST